MEVKFKGMVLGTGSYTNKKGEVKETIEFLDFANEQKFQVVSDVRVDQSAKYIPTDFALEMSLSGGQFGSKMFGHVSALSGKKA